MGISLQRVENFSDCVISIIMTIMVLYVPVPESFTLDAVRGMLGAIVVFFASFFVVGSQWNRHLFLFSRLKNASGKLIWRNMLFLFFLSLIPFFTKWLIQNPAAVMPAVCYSVVYMLVTLSEQLIFRCAFDDIGSEEKTHFRDAGRFSAIHFLGILVLFAGVIGLSFFYPQAAIVFFIGLPVVSSLLNIMIDGWERRGAPGERQAGRRRDGGGPRGPERF